MRLEDLGHASAEVESLECKWHVGDDLALSCPAPGPASGTLGLNDKRRGDAEGSGRHAVGQESPDGGFPSELELAPEFDVFVGFTYGNMDRADRESFFGFQATFYLVVHDHLRLVIGEAGAQMRRSEIEYGGEDASFANLQLLWGPEFVLRSDRSAWFAHVLSGLNATYMRVPTHDPRHPELTLANDYGFAMAIGGGLDIAAGEKLAVRAFQIDYFPTRLERQPYYAGNRLLEPLGSDWQNNFRLATGLVYTLK